MIICILGRQPELSLAELEQRFGSGAVVPFSDISAAVTTDEPFDVQRFGGIVKAGQVVAEFNIFDWNKLSTKIVQHYTKHFSGHEGKLTLGISVYGKSLHPRDVQRVGLGVKQALKRSSVSVRLIPNQDSALSTATSHHNKLGLSENKRELLVVFGERSVILAESVGSQNITALAARDQGRPKRDAFVGMLPPKLALMMVNLSGLRTPAKAVDSEHQALRILDPFCGTGVVLQEAALLGFDVYGSDLAEKMVDYSTANLAWLTQRDRLKTNVTIEAGDAIEHRWNGRIDAVVAETYLGQPFSAPPAPEKLEKVVRICNEIISKFLLNLGDQIEPGTKLCLAVPAWRDNDGYITQLPLVSTIGKFGYIWQPLRHVNAQELLYYREDQVVARQLLILVKQ